MSQRSNRLGILGLALVAGCTAQAQSTITTGSVSGRVTDAAGNPLGGARVILTSTQMSRTFTTGADGTFRAGLLNPGAWDVKVLKAEFQTQSGKVIVSPGVNQTANFKLQGISSATVTVVATATVLDATSVSLGQSITLESIASIPQARDFTGIAMFAPGVVSNGGFNANSPSMSGASGAENAYYVDGLDTTDYRYGYQGAQLMTNFIDQVSIQTGGFAPEFNALGGVFNAITKSGTNQIRGTAWTTWDAPGLHAALKKSQYFQESNLDVENRMDFGAEVSGPLIKDKLFFFVGFDDQIEKGIETWQTDPVLSDGRPKNDSLQTVFKVNWFITTDMQLTWFGNYNKAKLDTGSTYYYTYPNNVTLGSLYGNDQVGLTDTTTGTNSNVSFDWTISSNLSLSVKGGFTVLDRKQLPLDTTDNQTLDSFYYSPQGPSPNATYFGNQFATGGFGVWTQDEKDKTNQFNVALTWIVGDHTVKFGAGYLKSDYTLAQMGSGAGGYQYNIANDGTVDGNPALLQAVLFLNAPATVSAKYRNVFLQDNWEAVKGLHIIYGLRWEGQQQFGYDGAEIFNFSKLGQSLQPRLGLTWDVNNDAKTKVSAAFARYYEHIPQRAAIRTWGRETYLAQNYGDTGGSWTYDPTTPTHAIITGNPGTPTDYSTLFNQDPIAIGAKLPQRDEITLGIDHTFDSGWTLGLHLVTRKLTHPLEDSEILGPDGAYSADGHAIWWNPGPSVSWTQTYVSSDAGTTYNVPNTGFPTAENKYNALTLSADYRTGNDYFSANWTWSRLYGNYEGVISSSNLQPDGNITASYDAAQYVGYGPLPLDHTHVIKVQYSHRFVFDPGDLNVGLNYSYTSGSPISLFDAGAATLGVPEGSVAAGNPLDPLGYGNSTPAFGSYGNYGRTPANQNTDVHIDFQYRIGAKMRLAPSVDVFNFFNSRATVTVQQAATFQFSGAADPRWGYATAWQDGRAFRFGLKLTF